MTPTPDELVARLRTIAADQAAASALDPRPWIDLVAEARRAGALDALRSAVGESLVMAAAGDDPEIPVTGAGGLASGLRATRTATRADAGLLEQAGGVLAGSERERGPVAWMLAVERERILAALGDDGALDRLGELARRAAADPEQGPALALAIRFALLECWSERDGRRALALARELVADADRLAEDEPAHAVTARIRLAELLGQLEVRPDVVEAWRDAAELASRMLGEDAEAARWARLRLAETLVAAGRAADVVGLETLQADLDADAEVSESLRLRCAAARANAAAAAGDLGTALALQREAVARALDAEGPRSETALRARAAIVETLARSGEAAEAESIALALVDDARPEDDESVAPLALACAAELRALGLLGSVDRVHDRGRAAARSVAATRRDDTAAALQIVVEEWARAVAGLAGTEAAGEARRLEVELLAAMTPADPVALSTARTRLARWSAEAGRPEEALETLLPARDELAALRDAGSGAETVEAAARRGEAAAALLDSEANLARVRFGLDRVDEAVEGLGAALARADARASSDLRVVRSLSDARITFAAMLLDGPRPAEALDLARRAHAADVPRSPLELDHRHELAVVALRSPGGEEEGEALLRAALADLERAEPVDPGLHSRMSLNLGMRELATGRHEAARDRLAGVLERQRDAGLTSAPDLADRASGLLAEAHAALGEHEAEVAVLRELLDRRLRRDAGRPDAVATARQALANALLRAGDAPAAVEELRAALHGRPVHRDGRDRLTLDLARDLGVAMVLAGDSGAGAELLGRVAADAEVALGSDDPLALGILHDAATGAAQAGDLGGAVALRRVVADHWSAVDPVGDGAMAALDALIGTLRAGGRLDEEIAAMHELRRRRALAGADPRALAGDRLGIAERLVRAGRPAGALAEAEASVRDVEAALGPDSSAALEQLAMSTRIGWEVARAEGRRGCARLAASLDGVLARLRAGLGDAHPATAEVWTRRGRALGLSRVRFREVEAVFGAALAAARAVDPSGPAERLVRQEHAYACVDRNRWLRAAALLGELIEQLRAESLEVSPHELRLRTEQAQYLRGSVPTPAARRRVLRLLDATSEELGPESPAAQAVGQVAASAGASMRAFLLVIAGSVLVAAVMVVGAINDRS